MPHQKVFRGPHKAKVENGNTTQGVEIFGRTAPDLGRGTETITFAVFKGEHWTGKCTLAIMPDQRRRAEPENQTNRPPEYYRVYSDRFLPENSAPNPPFCLLEGGGAEFSGTRTHIRRALSRKIGTGFKHRFKVKKMKDVVKQRNSPNEGENGSFLSELSPTRAARRLRLQLLFGSGNVTLPPQTQRHKKSPAQTDRANPTTEAQAMQSRCPWIATP